MSAGRPATEQVVLRPSSSAEESPAEESPAEESPPTTRPDERGPLLDDVVAEDFLQRWSDVQARFVDDPKTAVGDADALVTDLLQALAAQFGVRLRGLEQQWQRGGEPRTEDLRLALQSYRSLFQRLLHA